MRAASRTWRGPEQRELAVQAAVGQMAERCENERRATLEEARAAVQASALQQAEEIEAVLAEMAELRAENVRLAEGAIVKKAKGGVPMLAEALADPPEEEGHAEVD